MSSYRFCRTDDIGLLTDALNRCWSPYCPGEPPTTPSAFKRAIRDLQVWCSSCMVAFAGSEPIGVLIGAKRSTGTLVHRIAVHPEHRRQGHGGHLLTSLASKLAILGPPRIAAEVPERLEPACELFESCGYAQAGVLTDYVAAAGGSGARAIGNRFVIPVTLDDLVANGLLSESEAGVCWDRSIETLTARKAEINGVAIATDERIEACILYVQPGVDAEVVEVLALRSLIADGADRLDMLMRHVRAAGARSFEFRKVCGSEVAAEDLEALGFRPAAMHRVYSVIARSD